MKFCRALLVLIFLFVCTNKSFGENIESGVLDINTFLSNSRIIDNKVYLEPGTIYISSHQIFLNVYGQFLPVENLAADKDGIFVTVEGVLEASRNYEMGKDKWYCPKCGNANSMSTAICRCGTERPR